MVSWLRKFISLLLSLTLIAGFSLPSADAAVPTITIEETFINPLYAYCLSQEDLQAFSPSDWVLYANPEYLTSIAAAGNVLRECMKNRDKTVRVYLKTDTYDGNQDSIKAIMRAISDAALAHTGDPAEGDYLMWQYGGWNGNASGTVESDGYYWTFTYTLTYYTTADQEAEVEAAVDSLLSSLELSGQTDYQKIQTVYDYICTHVSYDREHLNDTSYKRQFTAYAALLDGKAVCQGFALLFYRLALELGVDARLIPGTSRGENHGWNIVQLDGLYYNGDTTWDAGKSSYDYFLKCEANFDGHIRDSAYDSPDFHSSFPMSPKDYTPTTEDLCTHSYSNTVTVKATCTADGIMTRTCSICGNVYTETIKAQGHQYDSVIMDPTCTEDGTTTYTCGACGDSYSERIPPKGHSWNEGTVLKEPSAKEEGTLEYRCTSCPAIRTTVIPKLDSPAIDGVYRLSGSNRYKTAFLTADLLKQQLSVEKFDCAVIASGTNFADALSGSYLASVKKAPILLVDGSTISDTADYLKTNLKPGGTVYILGGTAAVPAALEDKLASFRVERLYGPNRYDTNLKILEAAGVADADILICTGLDFADSLSASALNRPILLVNKTLTDAQREFLAGLEGNDLYIIGGAGAVSEELAKSLTVYGSGTLRRISGKTRYDTSIQVADTFFSEKPDHLVLAYGHNFPDGLCGGVLAYSMNAPLILTRDSDRDLAAAYASDFGITTGAVLGGTKLISDAAVRRIFQMADSDPIQKP